MDDTKIIIVVMALVVIGGAFYFGTQWWNAGGSDMMQKIARVEATEVFSCAEGKGITAALSEGQVSLALSDGREFTLEQTPSTMGLRYANEGDAVVFFTQADDAYLEESGVKTYAECVQTSFTMGETKEESVPQDPNALMTSGAPMSSYDRAAMLFVGKWRNEASQNQIFKIAEGGTFQESFLTKTGQFMVPEGTWRLEKVAGAPENFDLLQARDALMFIRVSEKGEERRFHVESVASGKIVLKETNDTDFLTLVRMIEGGSEVAH